MIQIASPQIGKEERDAVDRVLRSGIIAQGPEVAKFEEEFAEACGCLLYTSPSPRDLAVSRMPSSA